MARSVKPIVFLAFVCLWILPAPARGAGENKLTVAMLRSATQTPYYVAAEAGLFKSYGLDVAPVQFSGGTQSLMALISGDVQLNTSGGPAAINAMMKGGGVVIIATNVGVFPYILYAHPAIKKPEDLKGKRVGIAGLGGVTHFAMIFALRKLGLNPDSDVTLTTIGDAGARLAAAVSGTISATLVQPPESLKAKELGLNPIFNLAQSGVKFPGNQITANLSYLRANRDSVKRFMMGAIAGLAKVKADRAFTMKVMEKYLRISDPKLLSEAYDFWVSVYKPKYNADPEEIETYFTMSNIKAKPQDFVDNSILVELDREGFFEATNKKYGVR
ncbi:MAG TPA: ABC transporter substrate-binding protein [Candidatus Binatia bacterium]|jgi:NitT/TauT family transport system substrate-binding protein